MAVTNAILARMTDYGESRETIEAGWESWIHHLPFDVVAGESLDNLYRSRLSQLDSERDSIIHHTLVRKRALLQERMARYRKERFRSVP
jgi:hypothetical protein